MLIQRLGITRFYVNTLENPPRSSWVHPLGPLPPLALQAATPLPLGRPRPTTPIAQARPRTLPRAVTIRATVDRRLSNGDPLPLPDLATMEAQRRHRVDTAGMGRPRITEVRARFSR
ncbi:hypothetical protein C8Q80DRAFT_1158632, partial [Daedaleopsis nitida]